MPSAHKIIGKMIVVIEIELEKEIEDVAGEVCRRISMHPDVRDANWITQYFTESKVKLNERY